MTSPELPAINEPHDVYEASVSEHKQRRQQHETTSRAAQPSPRPSSSSGSAVRSLRRTPRLEERHRGSSQSASTPPVREHPVVTPAAQSVAPRHAHELRSEDLGGSSTSGAFIAHEPSPGPEALDLQPRPTRISRRTASAILYALEEAIRTPYPFTPDLEEENATMADLMSGGTSNGGQVRGSSNGGSRGPVPVQQYSAPGVRGPRDIMRERQAREARKQAETEAREREEEEDDRRRSAERRTTAAGVAGRDAGGGRAGQRRSSGAEATSSQPHGGDGTAGERMSGSSAIRAMQAANAQSFAMNAAIDRPGDDQPAPRPAATAGGNGGRVTSAGGTTRVRGSSVSQPQPQPRPVPTNQPPDSHPEIGTQPPRTRGSQTRPVTGTAATSQAQAGVSAAPSASQPPPPTSLSAENSRRNTTSSSFPHAFERWETLSSHWEGLTSYWIRRLEQNSEEVRREPLAQQMARQITDLSAAGANLFHAVVELQRLRASSERKFQRWFHETKTEQERSAELRGKTESLLRQEYLKQQETLRLAVARAEKDKALAETMVDEMKRELQISKEEARRAWEELGRREQEELERTRSLREGQPTLVGGVQVVPMAPGALSRGGSLNRPTTREGPPTGGVGRGAVAGESGQGGYDDLGSDSRSGTDDPFLEAARRARDGEESSRRGDGHTATTNGTTPTSSTRTVYPVTAPEVPMPPPSSSSSAAPAATSSVAQYPAVPVSQSSATAPFYQHRQTSIHEPERVGDIEPDSRSSASRPSEEEAPLSEEEYEIDEQGNFRLDSQGRRIVYRRGAGGGPSEGSDDYDVREDLERERAHAARYGGGYASTTSAAVPARGAAVGGGWSGGPSGSSTAPDYSGTGYGSGWENLPRHHHPTRLSDVLEEDERSRTSPSRASQNSRR